MDPRKSHRAHPLHRGIHATLRFVRVRDRSTSIDAIPRIFGNTSRGIEGRSQASSPRSGARMRGLDAGPASANLRNLENVIVRPFEGRAESLEGTLRSGGTLSAPFDS